MHTETLALSMHEAFENRFVPGLTHPLVDAPTDIVSHADGAAQRRYNVYRNNVTVSLIDALVAIYPAVQRITGETFFRAMARFYVRASPPSSALLFEYGRDFPEFIERYAYAREMPWLADTARVERAWLDAYHAADRPSLSFDRLAAIDAAKLGRVRFVAHPATRIVRSRYPAVAIFVMNKQEGPVSPLCSSDQEDALITRPDDEVLVSRLAPGGAAFLLAMMAGQPLAHAVEIAATEHADFDLAQNMAAMISTGVFTDIHFQG